MSSMSYCIFENTYTELSNCYDVMNELHFSKKNLTVSEKEYFDKLIKLCAQIKVEFIDEVESV